MEILQKAMKANQASSTMNSWKESKILKPEEIFLLVGTLYHLPINGAKIRAQVEELKHVQHKFSRSREQIVDLPADANSSSVMADLKQILT
jgi:deoxyxylulose-5-phosphate synthase